MQVLFRARVIKPEQVVRLELKLDDARLPLPGKTCLLDLEICGLPVLRCTGNGPVLAVRGEREERIAQTNSLARKRVVRTQTAGNLTPDLRELLRRDFDGGDAFIGLVGDFDTIDAQRRALAGTDNNLDELLGGNRHRVADARRRVDKLHHALALALKRHRRSTVTIILDLDSKNRGVDILISLERTLDLKLDLAVQGHRNIPLVANLSVRGNIFDGEALVRNAVGTCRGLLSLVQDANRSIGQLGHGRIGEPGAILGDIKGVVPADATVILHQTDIDRAIDAAARRRTGQDDGSLAVDLLGIGDRVDLAPGVDRKPRGGQTFLVPPRDTVIGGNGIPAVAGEQVEPAIGFDHRGLGSLVLQVIAAVPRDAVIGIDGTRVAVALTVLIGVARQDDAARRGHDAAAWSHTIEAIIFVDTRAHLLVEHHRVRPAGAAVARTHEHRYEVAVTCRSALK